MKLLIIEPWFTGEGHPAQSLLNTASAIGRDDRVDYLVSFGNATEKYSVFRDRLGAWGRVFSFSVSAPVGAPNTIRAFLRLALMSLSGIRYQRVLFFDATLPVVALFWPIFSVLLGIDRVGVIQLQGPEVLGGRGRRWLIKSFLRRSDVRLYLRTEELALAWRDQFSGKILHLPSLEIPEKNYGMRLDFRCAGASDIKFGIIGQIRRGKGIDLLVRVFRQMPLIGQLTIAGGFSSNQAREELSILSGFDGFIEGFLSEEEMLKLAAEQDYLLMLYDEDWDPRLESAVLYLAARVNKPVIVYEGSWSGRMVREYGCGLLARTGEESVAQLLMQVPKPEDVGYAALLQGVASFRDEHSVGFLRTRLLDELLG